VGNPALASPQLSADGLKLAFLRPAEKNLMQVFVRTIGFAEDVQVTNESSRSVRTFGWTEDGLAVWHLQDQEGDERFHVLVTDLATRTTRDLTPWPKTRNEVLDTNPRSLEVLLVASNRRDSKVADVLRINWRTGAAEEDTRNPGDVVQWLVDADFRVRGAKAMLANGATEIRVRDPFKGPWRLFMSATYEDTLRPFGFSLDGRSLLVGTTISSDTERIVEKSLKSGTERLLTTHPKRDPVDVMWNRVASTIRAVSYESNGRREWTSLDWQLMGEFDLFRAATLAVGDFDVVSTDRADQRWVIQVSSDTLPPVFFLWDRKTKQALKIGASIPRLDASTLAPMSSVAFVARDGVTIQGYLTTPVGLSPLRLPMVLWVHGGPWEHVRLGFQPLTQFFANRGIAVLQVNFRGSTGFGRRHLNAGNRQWGLAMQDDLADAVAWAVKDGVADPMRVAIAGQGYGGFASLTGMAKTPDLYRCGVTIMGPTNLVSYLSAAANRLGDVQALRRVGNPADPNDKEWLMALSPSAQADRIVGPLLVVQGINDWRQKPAETDAFVSNLKASRKTVTSIGYNDEGSVIVRHENRVDLAARMEAFLAACLSSRSEPTSLR
jgi:dipeptidyl aminopeptidase/acylaminoacyl peptidase